MVTLTKLNLLDKIIQSLHNIFKVEKIKLRRS